MKDQYAGDVGDFGKLGMLRYLFPYGAWRLGVVWYLTLREPRKLTDGRFVQYLKKCSFRDCDPDLFDELKVIAKPPKGSGRKRSVAEIEKSRVLGKNTVFFAKVLRFSSISALSQSGREARLKRREEWLIEALNCTRDCDVVFLDPDNGLEVSSTKRHEMQGPKFVYWDELREFVDRKQVVVVYHHLNRNKKHGSHRRQIADRKRAITDNPEFTCDVICLRFAPYSPRAFFILGDKHQIATIHKSVERFLMTPWKSHFELI